MNSDQINTTLIFTLAVTDKDNTETTANYTVSVNNSTITLSFEGDDIASSDTSVIIGETIDEVKATTNISP